MDNFVALAHQKLPEDQELLPIKLDVSLNHRTWSVAETRQFEVAKHFTLDVRARETDGVKLHRWLGGQRALSLALELLEVLGELHA